MMLTSWFVGVIFPHSTIGNGFKRTSKQEDKLLKRRYRVVSMVLMSAFLFIACGGGGGNASAPVLSNASISPSSVMAGANQSITITFDFTDSTGDLNGGALWATYEGHDVELCSLGSTFAGVTAVTGNACN
jgi:hypothetical protein